MADNASITILRNTKANIDAEPIKDGNILFTTDQAKNKIYTDVGTTRIQIGGTVDVDTELSTTSTNPVQNKVIANSIDDLATTRSKLGAKNFVALNMSPDSVQTLTNLTSVTNQTEDSVTLTSNANNYACLHLYYMLPAGQYIVSYNFESDDTSYQPSISVYNVAVGGLIQGGNNIQKDAQRIITVEENYEHLDIRLFITKGNDAVVRTGTYKNLMIRLATDLDSTYQPYAMTNKELTDAAGRLNEDVANLFDMFHPIGSLFPTTDASFNPNTATGWHGTWERIKDCVIYAAGDSDTVGQIVGSNTHTLTTAELPSHTHSIPALSGTAESNGAHKHDMYIPSPYSLTTTNPISGAGIITQENPLSTTTDSAGAHTHTVTTNASTTGSQGSGTAIDMRTRRLNSVVWRRTA